MNYMTHPSFDPTDPDSVLAELREDAFAKLAGYYGNLDAEKMAVLENTAEVVGNQLRVLIVEENAGCYSAELTFKHDGPGDVVRVTDAGFAPTFDKAEIERAFPLAMPARLALVHDFGIPPNQLEFVSESSNTENGIYVFCHNDANKVYDDTVDNGPTFYQATAVDGGQSWLTESR